MHAGRDCFATLTRRRASQAQQSAATQTLSFDIPGIQLALVLVVSVGVEFKMTGADKPCSFRERRPAVATGDCGVASDGRCSFLVEPRLLAKLSFQSFFKVDAKHVTSIYIYIILNKSFFEASDLGLVTASFAGFCASML